MQYDNPDAKLNKKIIIYAYKKAFDIKLVNINYILYKLTQRTKVFTMLTALQLPTANNSCIALLNR